MKIKKYNIGVLLLLLLAALSACKDSNNNEEIKMENENLSSRLRQIKLMEIEKLDSLSNEIVIKSREDSKQLIKLLHSENKEEVKKAAMVLQSIGDLAITPLMDSLDRNNPDNYAWEMELILSLHLKNRSKIIKELNSMFLDTRLLKGPELIGVVEEKPVPRRVCDEAYLMLRKLLALEEDEESLMTNERLFLDMTLKEKDEEIQRLKSSGEWISLSEKMMDEGEF